MRLCNHSDYSPELSKQYDDMALDGGFCFDNQHVIIGGDSSGAYVKYIEVLIKPCVNSTFNNFSCDLQENVDYFVSRRDVKIAMHHESLSYDASKYNNPVRKILIEDCYTMDPKLSKSYRYNIENFIVYSQTGFVVTRTINQTFYQIDNVVSDYSTVDDNDPNKYLFRFMIQSSINTKTQNRSYLQVSDVIAQVGGALNAYLIMVSLVLKYLYQRKMNEKLMRELFIDEENSNNYGFTPNLLESKIIKKSELNLKEKVSFKEEKEIYNNSLAFRENSRQNIKLIPMMN